MENSYPHKTAGWYVTDKVPTIGEGATVGEVEQLLLRETKNFETVNYIYVLDNEGHLKGVVSLKEVFRSSKDTPIKNFVSDHLVSVRTSTHQERVARLALSHKIKAIPVIDKDNKFIGVVDSDQIMAILESEGIEDILKFGGVSYKASFDDVSSLSLITSLRHRLPWMIVGLFGGMIAAGIVGSYEEVLSGNLILAAFIPLIAYMANAVGAQLEVFIIRDFAVNPKFEFIKYFGKQASVVFSIAFIVSLILYFAGIFLYGDLAVSLVLGVSLFIAILTSLLTGLILPYLFGKMRLDPANAAGPIATIIQDSLSVFVYLYIASIIL